MAEYMVQRQHGEFARGLIDADSMIEAASKATGIDACNLEMRSGRVECAQWIVWRVGSSAIFSVRERWT